MSGPLTETSKALTWSYDRRDDRIRTCDPLTPRSTQPCSSAFDLRCDPVGNGAVGAGLSSALSSPLSSVNRSGLALVLRYPLLILTRLLDVAGGVSDDLGRWGPCGVPSTWRSPKHGSPGAALDGTGTGVVSLCPRAAVWSPSGKVDGMPHPAGRPATAVFGSAILETCRGAGGERPRLVPSNLVSGLARGTNLQASDYQDSAGHGRAARLVSADTSRRYVLVLDVSVVLGR
jgi:hypothetical protein